MKKKKKNSLLRWLIEEGAIQKKENIYMAELAFMANAYVNWIRKEINNENLKNGDIEESMNLLRLFLQKKIDLKWNGNAIKIFKIDSDIKKKESVEKYQEISNAE